MLLFIIQKDLNIKFYGFEKKKEERCRILLFVLNERVIVLVHRIFHHPLAHYYMIRYEMHFFIRYTFKGIIYEFLFMYAYLSPLLIHETVQCIKNRTPNHQKIYHMLGYTQKILNHLMTLRTYTAAINK